MVGALSVVGSSLVESHACPCVLSPCNLVSGDLALQRGSIGKKHVQRSAKMEVELSTSFLDSSLSTKALLGSKKARKTKKNRSLVVVDELGGQYEEGFDDVKLQLLNYFTYKAVRTVLNQLYEMNPPQYRWFYNYIASNKPSDGKRFIRELVKEQQELAERVMVTRLHLYGRWIKKCDHADIYKQISDQNVELMRERLIQTVIWPSDDTNTEVVG